MPRKGITGHDGWVITEALATALGRARAASTEAPIAHPNGRIQKTVGSRLPALGPVNLHLAQAKCRLFPDVDRATIYREYGLEDGSG